MRRTVATWRDEYNCERPHSSLGYRTPAEFRQALGYEEVETAARFPLPHSLGGGESTSASNLKPENLSYEWLKVWGHVNCMMNLPHLEFIHKVIGANRILYSVDYPYLNVAGARRFL